MTSPSLIDQLINPRKRAPFLPLYNASARSSNEYDLDELEPRPEEPLAARSPPQPRLRKPAHVGTLPALPRDFTDSRASSSGSPSKTRSKAMYAGPPPPIASSRYIRAQDSHLMDPLERAEGSKSHGLLSTSRLNLGSTFFDQRKYEDTVRQDSIWRGLRRREKVLEREVQQLLDLQASGLVAGSRPSTSENGTEIGSDADGSSMVGTFYSTATSKSHMINSLHMPARSTPDGNVIPVRQPVSKKPGIRSARAGLRRTMAALSELKLEESAHVDAALAQRKDALAYLDRMSARKDGIMVELRALEDDSKEPLGQELRGLAADHDALSEEIHRMEEKLIGLRNRRRSVRERMDTLKNQREAGLSGYRAAGRDIDMEVRALMERPPITPLDMDALDEGNHRDTEESLESPGGPEFLRLRPERRTAEMAKMWWKGEVTILERRKAQILADHKALDEGARLWSEVTTLVADFESSLRAMLQPGVNSPEIESTTNQDTSLRTQLSRMDSVVDELEKRLQYAEERHWNLLICAVGAELEAFVEARNLLSSSLQNTAHEPQPNGGGPNIDAQSEHTEGHTEGHTEDHTEDRQQDGNEESDNEVPPDLLISHHSDHVTDGTRSPQRSVVLRRQDSENEVPREFLAEHGDKVD